MKKSTLITTIAMIVVVVVALSTATYAWFSSSATAVATSHFTTEVSGDWTIMVGNWTNNNLEFNGTAADSIDLTETAVQGDLWCPTGAISTTLASAEASTSAANLANFVNAKKNGDGDFEVAKIQSDKVDGTTAGNGVAKPFALRLVNVSGVQKTLQLNITLNAGNNGTNNSMYAAAAVRFYIYEVTSAANNNTATYTSGYGYANETSTLNALTNIPDEPKQTITKATAPITQVATEDLVDLADYNVGDISSQFTAAAADDAALGISKDDKVLTYTFNMGTYAPNAYSNIIIYAWVDGWVANASAAKAVFDVNFGFISAPAQP